MQQDKLMISCQNHPDSLISLVNLSQNVPQSERLYCLDGCQWVSAPKSLNVFLKEWDEKRQSLERVLIKEKEKFINSSQFILKKLQVLIDDIHNQLALLLQEFDTQTKQGILQYELKQKEFTKIPNSQITRGILLQMIENFTKTQDEFPQVQIYKNWQQQCYDSVQAIQDILAVKRKPKIDYQLINKLNQKQIVRAMAFNSQGNILIAGCSKEIIVYDFQNELLKQKQVLQGHKGIVAALCYSKFNDYFVSGGKDDRQAKDSTLRLWVKNSMNQFENTQILEQHTSSIEHVIFDQEEKQMISCDDGNNILIWQYNLNNQWDHLQTLKEHTGYVYSLSLSNHFLISTSYDKSVKIWRKQEDNSLWNLFQNLEFEEYGFRIAFISNLSFIFLSVDSEYLRIFKFIESDQKFQEYHYEKEQNEKLKFSQGKLKCYWRFPCIFNEALRILVIKHQNTIYIFQVDEQDDKIQLTKLKEIPFKTQYIYGQLSSNGSYLITYDEALKDIQTYRLNISIQ